MCDGLSGSSAVHFKKLNGMSGWNNPFPVLAKDVRPGVEFPAPRSTRWCPPRFTIRQELEV